MKRRYLYGKRPAEVESAAGVKGMIIRTPGGALAFRVYHDNDRFTDYDIRHDDLSVTIDEGALAAFYKVGEHHILGHSPEVLGLKSVNGMKSQEGGEDKLLEAIDPRGTRP